MDDIKKLEEKIAALEHIIQEQQKEIDSLKKVIDLFTDNRSSYFKPGFLEL